VVEPVLFLELYIEQTVDRQYFVTVVDRERLRDMNKRIYTNTFYDIIITYLDKVNLVKICNCGLVLG